jgi:outer membrane protein OmpA-like peptidoglycan-associated protein
MYCAPSHTLGRALLVSSALGLGAMSLYGQDSTAAAPMAPPPPASGQSQMAPKMKPVSRIDIFAGYSYLAPHGQVTEFNAAGASITDNYQAVDVGAIGSAAFFFNKYAGLVVEYADHTLGKGDGAGHRQDTFQNALGGVIFRYPTDQGVTPFVHAMAGGSHVSGPNDAANGVFHRATWGPALKVGGGLDFQFGHSHLAWRVFQADYIYNHNDFGRQAVSGGRANINSAELSTGLVFGLGNIQPPPPITYACSVNPMSVFPGEPVTITGTATNLNPKKTPQYTWQGQGGVTVNGTSSTATVDTTNLQPGQYTVTGHVSQGTKAGQMADCTANFTVKQFEPPTISCSANPSTVNPGDSSTITSVGVSPQNRPLTYSYSASAGNISGTTNTATLATTGAPAGTITVTCNVADDKGQTATTTTTVTVSAPPAPTPKTQTLCSITFDRDKKRPARVDNEAKACLDDVTLNLQRDSSSTLTVVGNSATDQMAMPMGKHHHAMAMDPAKLAAQRAVNTKAYLVTEKGIDASRISVRTGTKGTNEVDNYLVPAGSNFDTDMPGSTAVDESMVKAQARTAAPAGHGHARHHHHKAMTGQSTPPQQ